MNSKYLQRKTVKTRSSHSVRHRHPHIRTMKTYHTGGSVQAQLGAQALQTFTPDVLQGMTEMAMKSLQNVQQPFQSSSQEKTSPPQQENTLPLPPQQEQAPPPSFMYPPRVSSLSSEVSLQEKPKSQDIIALLKVVFRESWFQDQFLDILSKNIQTQYFNKILEITLFNIFNHILDNVNKNDNIIITISLLKNNTKFFEELLKDAIVKNTSFYENERIFSSTDNVLRITGNTVKEYSRAITKIFRELLMPDIRTPLAQQVNDQQTIEFENIRAKYLLDLEKEKIKLEEDDKVYKEKKRKDREDAYRTMINQNIQAQISPLLDEPAIQSIMKFFNNIEESVQNDDTHQGAVIINGEQYNEMIIRTICDCIRDILQKEDSMKEIIRIVLKRFDYMLKEFIDIMQNNGILKVILLRIFDNYPFIFEAFNAGIEKALNKKIDAIAKIKQISDVYITKADIQSDYAFFASIVGSVIDELTSKLELFIPSEENPQDRNDTLTQGGGNTHDKRTTRISPTKKRIVHYLKEKRKKTYKKPTSSGGWFW